MTPLAIGVATMLPYIIENVEGASSEMATTLRLHGGMFGLGTHRPRMFESNVLVLAPMAGRLTRGKTIAIYGDGPSGRKVNRSHPDGCTRYASSLEEAQRAMGMDWADWHGTKEAIPPAYTEWIGVQLLRAIELAA